MKKIKIDRAIQERPATRKQTRNEKIRQSLTEHVDVQVIPAITDREGYEKPKLRVCAYCRVSTDMDTQALSYELQVQNYTDYIRGNDEWQFAGIYADRGISGTSLKHRDEFNRMIEDCKAGKIDLPTVPEGCVHNAHMFYIKARDLEQRTRFISYMKENGVLTVFHYIPLHTSPAGQKFGRFHGEDRYTTRESERLVRLPMYYGLTLDQVDFICGLVKNFFELEEQ